jgi:hypothetical protein
MSSDQQAESDRLIEEAFLRAGAEQYRTISHSTPKCGPCGHDEHYLPCNHTSGCTCRGKGGE